MKHQKILWLAIIVTLVASLMAVPVVTGAQEPLRTSFTWAAYGVTLRHPEGWTTSESDTRVSVHPADRDVSAGTGPELVLFVQADASAATLDNAIEALAASVVGTTGPVMRGQIAGFTSRSFTFDQTTPAAEGSVTLLAMDAETVLGVAFIYTAADASVYLPTLREMRASLSFAGPGAAANTPALAQSSSGVASVQLPQVIAWDAVGLTFAFPADWEIDESPDGALEAWSGEYSDDDASYRAIAIHYQDRDRFSNLHGIMEEWLIDVEWDVEIADVLVNGMVGLVAEFVDREDTPAMAVRALLLDIPQSDAQVLVVFVTAENDWDAFRPVVNAFTNGITRRSNATSRLIPAESGISLVAAHSPAATTRWQQSDPVTYVWEEFGITFTLPEAWQAFGASQDYDLALVSPEAASGQLGAFITFRSVPFLGESFEDAMQPLADQVDSTVEPFSAAGLDGVVVTANDAEAGDQQLLILLPYGDSGESLYIQATVPPDGDADVVTGVLDRMVVEPLHADEAAINAAWQASLAENGTLVYGDADAPLKIVEYLSFTCGHCANYTVEISRLIALEVEQAERVRFELAPVMWDDYASRASRSFYCAVEQGYGYTAYKALYHGYFEDNYDVAYTEDGLSAIMTAVGLDMDAYQTCVDEDTYADVIGAVETRFRDGGMSGTPTLAFSTDASEPAPLVSPDGQIWSGRIPLSTVRTIMGLVLDDGVALADVLNQ